MKKLRTLLAAVLAMSLMLCGCGGESSEYPEEGAEDAALSQEEAPQDRNLTLGQVVENVYTNEYLDVYFAPNGWAIQGAGQLQNALEGAAGMLQGTELEETLEGLTQVMDMQGVAPDGINNVNVVYTKIGAAERLAYMTLDEEQILDAVLENMDSLMEVYGNAGISVSSMTKVPVNYRGEERLAIRTLGTVQGANICMLQIYECKLGSYAATITVTCLEEAQAAEVMGMFEKLNP